MTKSVYLPYLSQEGAAERSNADDLVRIRDEGTIRPLDTRRAEVLAAYLAEIHEKKHDPGFAIWLTGLPSSGKTTLAHALSRLFSERGVAVQELDSDDLRRRLTPNPTYSSEERDRFYDAVTFLAGLLTDNGVNVLIAATASRRAYRQAARDRIARFAEVYVDCSPEVCRARDPKGLWERAEKGEIKTLPGAGVPYEPPQSPEVRVDAPRLSVEEAADQIVCQLNEQGFFIRN